MGFTSLYGFCAYSLRLSSWPEAELLCDFAEGLPEYLSALKYSRHSPLPVSWLFCSVPHSWLNVSLVLLTLSQLLPC